MYLRKRSCSCVKIFPNLQHSINLRIKSKFNDLPFLLTFTVISFFQIIMANGPAKSDKVPETIQRAGEEIGDMFEISTIRREVYA